MLLRRIISALVGIPLLILAAWFGGIWFLAVMSIIVYVASAELRVLGEHLGLRPSKVRMSFGALLVLFVMYFTGDLSMIGFVFTLLLFLNLTGVLLDKTSTQQIFTVGLELSGAVYVGLGMSYMVLLRKIPGSLGIYCALLAFLITWLCDTSAYFIGIRFGKHQLCARFSPKKSIEGAIAGIVGAGLGILLVNCVVRLCFSVSALSSIHAVSLGVLSAIFGEFGDLFESMLKRDAKIKDSGNVIPGHGGMLDRFDSLLFVAPVVYYYVKWFVM